MAAPRRKCWCIPSRVTSARFSQLSDRGPGALPPFTERLIEQTLVPEEICVVRAGWARSRRNPRWDRPQMGAVHNGIGVGKSTLTIVFSPFFSLDQCLMEKFVYRLDYLLVNTSSPINFHLEPFRYLIRSRVSCRC